MDSNITPFKPSEPAAGRPFKIFNDDEHLEAAHRLATPQTNACFGDLNNENFDPSNNRSKPVLEFFNEPCAQPDSTSTVKRTPLADVTQEQSRRPRSFSAALAEIARLKGELELSQDENSKLKGAIVAFQDALYQADFDARYF